MKRLFLVVPVAVAISALSVSPVPVIAIGLSSLGARLIDAYIDHAERRHRSS